VLERLANKIGIDLDQAKLARWRAYLDEPVPPRIFTGGHSGKEVLVGRLDPEAEPGPHFSHGCVQVPVPTGPQLEPPFDRFRLALDGVVCPACNRRLVWADLDRGRFAPFRLELHGSHGKGPYPGEVVARITCGAALGDESPGCLRSSEVRCPVAWS